jgi:hypothetical protein
MCRFQVRRLSRVTPRYLTSFSVGIVRFFNVTCGQSRFLNEKVFEQIFSFVYLDFPSVCPIYGYECYDCNIFNSRQTTLKYIIRSVIYTFFEPSKR